jgi:nickel-dependent lactate racemase
VNHLRRVKLLYGREGADLDLPADAVVLAGQDPPPVANPREAVASSLADPIGSPPLLELVRRRRPRTVAITVSDVTRPVPNRRFLPALLEVLAEAGIGDRQISIIIGTGMHRPSTPLERELILGREILDRVEVIDHTADRPETLTRVADDPPVSVCRRFAEADFRIVTGYIEPHFMAGFSGGRKGLFPALVDLASIQRFHGFDTLADPRADNGILEGNPCHEIALEIALTVGVDFLFNVAITREREIAGIYCGDLVEAHRAGCREVAAWTTAELAGPFDLVVTCGGGYPLDQTFYQTVKGICTALPALGPDTTLLQLSHCGEGLGSRAYTELMLRWGSDWRGFLAHIEANRHETRLDQWELQVQCRVLARIGSERLWFASDGIPRELQKALAVTPLLGEGDAVRRAQRAIDAYLSSHPGARTAVIPEGPYTMLRARSERVAASPAPA